MGLMRKWVLGTVLVGMVAAVVGCGGELPQRSHPVQSTSAAPTPSVAPTADPVQPSPVLETLATLEVKGRAPKADYERAKFGQRWLDVDRNGCDTRNDVLRRDLSELVIKPGTQGCVAWSGILHDPYTGTDISFQRGKGPSPVDIDHVVALSDAWQKGASRWGDEQRAQFANDPLNLLAVDAPANRQKGDGDAATWLPANKSFRCDYVARQVAVKHKYKLWITPAERDAIVRVLDACPEQLPPDDESPAAERPAVASPRDG